jgi:DNA uptake protein ComE-like DNA-binding protein
MMNVSHLIPPSLRKRATQQKASVLVIVLWIAFGLVSIALYFGQSMLFNLQAVDNYEAGIQADHAIEGAARYISFVLTNLQLQVQSSGTNMPGILILPGTIQCYTTASGQTPYTQTYLTEEVPVGDAKFWLIGRDSGGVSNVNSDVPMFGLVDEASKLNLNTATLAMLQALPYMTTEAAASIYNWRTNATSAVAGGAELEYGMLNPPYSCKNAPFETIDELKLVLNVTTDMLYGADINLNGILDSNEQMPTIAQTGVNLDNGLNAGILNYVTIYSREPNTGRTNVNTSGLQAVLVDAFGQTVAVPIYRRVQQYITGPPARTLGSMLEFYARSGMTLDQFVQVADGLTATNATSVAGLVNVNTAPAPVLACVPGIGADNAQSLVAYRQAHPDQLATVAWVTQVLGTSPSVAQQVGPWITTKSYQFSADVAAVGHYGRGYRRTLFVFDMSGGLPKIIYRRDETQRNWALGNIRPRLQQTQTGKSS